MTGKKNLILSDEQYAEYENDPIIRDLNALMTANGTQPIDLGKLVDFTEKSQGLILDKILHAYVNGEFTPSESIEADLRAYQYFNNKMFREAGVINKDNIDEYA